MKFTAIKKLRAVSLACVAITLPVFAIAMFYDNEYFWLPLLFAHAFLFLFVATEAFGPVAQTRTSTNRVIARIFLSVCLVMAVSAVTMFAISALQ